MPVKIAKSEHQASKRRYKHTMRKSPYLISLILLLAATTLTLLNIYVANLVHVTTFPYASQPWKLETKYGLYRRCTRKSPSLFSGQSTPRTTFSREPQEVNQGTCWVCTVFPTKSECAGSDEKFCILWSTAGYAAYLSLVPCLASLISLLFIFLHRGQRTARARARRQQWKLVSGTMLIHCLLQVLSFSLILHVYRTDQRFANLQSHLDFAFTFGVIAAVISGTTAILLTFTGIAARPSSSPPIPIVLTLEIGAGKPWAAGKSARKARRHRRTRSGRVVAVPPGEPIPDDQIVTVGEVEAAVGSDVPTERTGLLVGQEGTVAGGGTARATDDVV